MRRNELLYDLPEELIAQQPAEPRDASRLLVVPADGDFQHRTFRDLSDYLRPGDCLVFNDTRVVPARFFARRATGGRVEGLFLHQSGDDWHCLLSPAARLKPGERLALDDARGAPAQPAAALRLVSREQRGVWRVQAEPATDAAIVLDRIGSIPLPPYIRSGVAQADDRARYQTVYAREPGSAAAPTAGLHFTPALLDRIREHGVRTAFVTLHVGLGTFAPIDVDDLDQHPMHAEWFRAPAATLDTLRAVRRDGGRIVAIGTTSARVLESVPLNSNPDSDACGWTDLFIRPPHAFRNLDVLVTNFHLPGSTLLALVMALGGVERIRAAYVEAVRERYRFFSYGDAMLVFGARG